MMTLTIALLLTQSPLFYCFITILQSLILVAISWTVFPDVWVVLMLFLIYFGGVMVLLVYVCALTQQDNLTLNYKIIWVGLPLSLFTDRSLPRWTSDSLATPITTAINIFHNSHYLLCCVLIVYMLIGLLVVVKITKFYQGSLRPV